MNGFLKYMYITVESFNVIEKRIFRIIQCKKLNELIGYNDSTFAARCSFRMGVVKIAPVILVR